MIWVAGYCRVSTEKEDQMNSFAAQQRYFREYIERQPGCVLYDIYADEGITGTSTKKRVQFNRMMEDARKGRFQRILTAIREKRRLRLRFLGRNNVPHVWRCIPYKLEYSPKDDKFRLITGNKRVPLAINLARITDCDLLEPVTEEEYRPKAMRKRELVLELTDERKALERCLFHFSHLEKETERLDDTHYRLTLRYEKDNETELLIRVLSFGHVLKVISPASFREKLKNRLQKQMQLRIQE